MGKVASKRGSVFWCNVVPDTVYIELVLCDQVYNLVKCAEFLPVVFIRLIPEKGVSMKFRRHEIDRIVTRDDEWLQYPVKTRSDRIVFVGWDDDRGH